jgi:PAS domain S-box-containing protein
LSTGLLIQMPKYGPMRHKYINIIFLTILLLIAQISFTQQYVVKNYSIAEGLPTLNVNDACQDKDGTIWFATNSGISRYDGFSFTNYDNTNGIPDQLYRKISIDEKGVIWAMPSEKLDTIIYFKQNKWYKLAPPKKEVQNYSNHSFGIIYKNNKPVICVGSYDGYYVHENDSWTHFRISKSDTLNYVYTVAESGNSFILSTKIGLCRVKDGMTDWNLNTLIKPYGLNIIAISFENKNTPDEKLWVLTETWLGYIKQNKFTMVTTKFQLPHPSIFYYTFLNSDKRGNIFFGNIWAKYFISKNSSVPVPLMVSNGFCSDGATSVFIDREQNIWITATRGIDKINNLKVLNYFEKDGLLENEVTAIAETNDGNIVLGHNIGLSIIERNKIKTIEFKDSKTNTRRVLDIDKDSKGNIWFVSISLGLAKLEQGNYITWYESGKYAATTAVAEDNSGKIWVGADRKLLYLQDNKLVEYKAFNDCNTIRKIFKSENGGIYICGLEGIWFIDNAIRKKIPSPADKKAESVYTYYKAKNGKEFVGTKNGLYYIQNGKIEKFNKNGIEISNPVFFIIQDNENNYWLGSNNGVYKWDGDSKIEIYNLYNGLAGWETNRAAGILDSKGRVWIGTDRGLSCFNPDYDKAVIPTPVIKLIDVEDNKGVHHDMNVKNVIAFSDNTLTFHFRGISFLNEHLIEYKYKLEGFDVAWQDVSQSMLDKVKYHGLRPGKYTFCVMAKNFSGNWSEITRSGTIRITPPLYLKWWFIILIITASGLVIYGSIRFYIQQIQNTRLEQEIVERKKIEHDLIESRQKYLNLVELLPESIFESDRKGKLKYMNNSGYKLFGYDQSQTEDNLFLQQFIAPENQTQIVSHLNTVIEQKIPEKIVISGLKRNGITFPLSIHTVPILNNNKCLGTRGIIIDLTEQKRYEDQLHKNAEDLKTLNDNKDKFFSIIAHDLRSPFTSFLGFTEILDEEFDSLPTNELQTIISSMRKSASNLYQLLENLLEWTLLHREITKFEPRRILLLPLINTCVDLSINMAKQKEIDIRIDVPETLKIVADIHMLQAILRNLISNAVKFTNRGGYIHISAGHTEEHFTLLSVKDSGVGITPDILPKLFRIDTNQKTKGTEGELSTGLGLILCKEFVERHGGKIWVESEPGKGSSFYFTLNAITS